MDAKTLLGTSFDCRCGRHHHVPTETYLYAEDAYSALPQLVKAYGSGGSCHIIADTRTYSVTGRDVIAALSDNGLEAGYYLVQDIDGETPVADDHTLERLQDELPEAAVYIAVGSGVINDLVKWMAHLRHTPYITVATAASMNGYGSANVAATIDRLKVLFHATAPKAVLAKPSIICNAPHELSTSGLGDVLAKPVSSADWKLNQFLFNEYYCQFAVDLLKELEPIYLDNPSGIKNRDKSSFAALFQALFFSSIAMTVTGTSSPASGGEHLISHTLDILAGRDGVSHDYHGRQVGVGSIFTAALYEKVMSIDTPTFTLPETGVDRGFWGTLTPVVSPEYDKKMDRMREASAILANPAKWQELRLQLSNQLIPAQRLKRCLMDAGGAHRYSDLRFAGKTLERELFRKVISNANQMRARFTILDLAELLGILPNEIDAIIDEWLTN